MRKKLILVLLAVCLLCFTLALTACHEHTYATEWSSDATNHWHQANCEHPEELVDLAPHTFGYWNTVADPTCLEDGLNERFCTVCNYRETSVITALGHDLQTHQNKLPNCEDYGWDLYDTCSRCDYTTYAEIPANGHSYGELIPQVDATCTESGKIAYYECSVCHKYFNEEKIEYLADALVIPPHGHKYGELVPQVDATCTQTGFKAHYECSVCHELFDTDKNLTTADALTISANGHAYNYVYEVKPSCTETGMSAHYKCTVCPQLFDENYVDTTADALVVPAKGHSYGGLLTQTDATCTVAGRVEHYKCGVCEQLFDANKQESTADELAIPATGHAYGDLVAKVEANCTQTGLEAHYKCAACNHYFDAQKVEVDGNSLVIPANGHDYGTFIPRVDATCDTEGTMGHYTCSVCQKHFGENYYEISSLTIKKLSHVYQTVYQVNATCDTDGTEAHYTCSLCHRFFAYGTYDEVTADSLVIPKGHTYSSTYTYDATNHWKNATCSHTEEKGELGAHTFDADGACTVCGFEQGTTLGLSYSKLTHSGTTTYDYYEVRGIGSATDTEIVIPSTYKGLPVEAIANNCFLENFDITSVVIPEGVRTIGEKAFRRCLALESVTIPESVTTIGKSAFEYCSKLTAIDIPSGVTEIPQNAFYGCTRLKSVNILENAVSNISSIGSYAFYQCADLTFVTIPMLVTTISNYAFYGCTDLISVDIHADVTSIGEGAFTYCYKLIEVHNLSSLDIVAGESANGNVAKYAKNVYGVTGQSNLVFAGIKSYVFYKDVDSYILMGYQGNDTELTLPSTLTVSSGNLSTPTEISYSICDYAFHNNIDITSVVIPDVVTSIGAYAFWTCSKLESVTIGSKVSSIGDSAFYYCTVLSTLDFGENSTLETIGPASFQSTAVAVLNIPASVQTIEIYAFQYCDDLVELNFAENPSIKTIEEYAFSGCCGITTLEIPSTLTKLGTQAFENCYNLVKVTVGNVSPGMTVGNSQYGQSFNYCFNLVEVENLSSINIVAGGYQFGGVAYYAKNVYVSDGSCVTTTSDGYIMYQKNAETILMGYTGTATELTLPSADVWGNYSISRYAFYSNRNIKSVVIPEGVTEIGNNTFYLCDALESVSIPASVKSIGDYAFYYCKKMATATIATNSVMETIGEKAFYNCDSLKEIYIPSSLISIGRYAFGHDYLSSQHETSLEKVVIGSNSLLETIGTYAFDHCTKLVSINLDACIKLTTIDAHAFYCSGLTSVIIPSSVTTLGKNCFAICNDLVNVVFSEGSQITVIPNSAFYSCDSLINIVIPDSVITICDEAFNGCEKLATITIGSGVTTIGDGSTSYSQGVFSGCTALEKVYYNGTIDQWAMITFSMQLSNPLYLAGHLYIGGVEVTEINLTTATAISDNAFKNWVGLTKATIGGSVATIGKSAFSDCENLTSVTISGSVASIGNYAFDGCSALESLTISSTLTSVGEYAFRNCEKLTTVVLPDGVTTLGNYAFYSCESLTSITIPASVTSIGNQVFNRCGNLTAINFGGTVEQWNAITKGTNWDSNTGDYTVTCSDGTVAKAA